MSPDAGLGLAGYTACWVEDDLEVAVFAPIEPAKRLGRVRERQPVRDDDARCDAPRADQVAQQHVVARCSTL